LSVRLRLSRLGRKKRPYYRIVAVDSRRKRDGAFIERLGLYHPLDTPARIEIDAERALAWLRDGARPSETVLSLLKREGVWLRFRLERRGLPTAQIDQMMNEWFKTHAKQQVEAAPVRQAAPAPVPKSALREKAQEDAVTAVESATLEQVEAAPETPVNAASETRVEVAPEAPVEAVEPSLESAEPVPKEVSEAVATASDAPPEEEPKSDASA